MTQVIINCRFVVLMKRKLSVCKECLSLKVHLAQSIMFLSAWCRKKLCVFLLHSINNWGALVSFIPKTHSDCRDKNLFLLAFCLLSRNTIRQLLSHKGSAWFSIFNATSQFCYLSVDLVLWFILLIPAQHNTFLLAAYQGSSSVTPFCQHIYSCYYDQIRMSPAFKKYGSEIKEYLWR